MGWHFIRCSLWENIHIPLISCWQLLLDLFSSCCILLLLFIISFLLYGLIYLMQACQKDFSVSVAYVALKGCSTNTCYINHCCLLPGILALIWQLWLATLIGWCGLVNILPHQCLLHLLHTRLTVFILSTRPLPPITHLHLPVLSLCISLMIWIWHWLLKNLLWHCSHCAQLDLILKRLLIQP